MPSNKANETPALRYNNQTGEPIIPEGYALRYDNQTGEPSLVKKRATRKKTAEPVNEATTDTGAADTAAAPLVAASAYVQSSQPASQAFPNYTSPQPASTPFNPQSANAAPVQLYDNSRCVGFFRRLLAFATDSLIAWLFTVLLSLVASIMGFGRLGFFTEKIFFGFTAANIAGYLLITLYFVLFTKWLGATPGKKLLRVMVVSSEPKPLSWWCVIYRETIGRYLTSLLLIGYLVLAVDPQHRGFHDMLADTRVVFE